LGSCFWAVLAVFALFVTSGESFAGEDKKALSKKPDWRLTLGAGGAISPDYEGSDDYEATPLPLIDLSWRDTVSIGTLGGPGVKVNYFKLNGPTPKDHLTLSAFAGYGGGRDQDDNDALQGLGDLDAGVILGLGAHYQYQDFGASLGINRDVTGDREGTTASAGLHYSFLLGSPKMILTLGTGLTWADDDYMSNVFGISGAQAANSRSGFAAFDASSGIKDVGVNAMLMHRWDENIGILGQVGYSRLLSDAADSPIVDQEGDAGQFSVLLGVTYSWGW
jgi:outer membrane scaffolding protein for murein synthesis (MipA/OmpV family)